MSVQAMKSGIFAVMNIGNLRLYVGEMHRFKERWERIMVQLEQGQCKHAALQAEWVKCSGDRKVTFHTLADLQAETTLLRYKQFVKDVQAKQSNVSS